MSSYFFLRSMLTLRLLKQHGHGGERSTHGRIEVEVAFTSDSEILLNLLQLDQRGELRSSTSNHEHNSTHNNLDNVRKLSAGVVVRSLRIGREPRPRHCLERAVRD